MSILCCLVMYDVEPRKPSPSGVGQRNVGVIGAVDAGKSTVTRRMVDLTDDDVDWLLGIGRWSQ